MPIKKKFSKLIVKDITGNLVQLLPEIKVDTTLDSTSDLPLSNAAVTQAFSNALTTDTAQTITGVKTFSSGFYGNVVTLNGNAIDVSLGSCFVKTVSANTTFSFTNIPTNVLCCITLVIINGGNYTVTWPNSVKWTDNSAPDLTASGKDVITFITYDSGTTWFGTVCCSGVTQ